MDPRAELWYATGKRKKDRELLEQIFREAGIEIEHRPHEPPPFDRGVDYQVTLGIHGLGAGAFLTAYCTAAGPSAWSATKELLQRLHERTEEAHAPRHEIESREGGPPRWLLGLLGEKRGWEVELELVESEKDAHICLRSTDPDKAFKQLFELETDRDTWYVWDRREWSAVSAGDLGLE